MGVSVEYRVLFSCFTERIGNRTARHNNAMGV